VENVLVTGGAGFIGSAIVRALLADEQVRRVLVVDNLSTGKQANLAEVAGKVEFLPLDIRNYAAIEPVFEGIDTVFHQAAIPSVPQSIEEPEHTHDVNVNGTLHVLRAADRKGVRRLVYAASCAAYGDSEALPLKETVLPNPKSPYAVQKLTGEYYARTFFEVYGLETVCLRYFNVFGPRQDPSSPYSGVLSLFCRALLAGHAPTIFGDGEQSRDFIYVENIARLNLLAARSEKAPGHIYNAGTGRRQSLNAIWSLMQSIEGIELPANGGAARVGDIRHSQADVTAARNDLGFEPHIDFEEGLRRTIAWYREASS
jgi:UDP-N-acetylglucosamine/UDP-N-acetyl-alpha-D-glucosaminouronate 4-epimerase